MDRIEQSEPVLFEPQRVRPHVIDHGLHHRIGGPKMAAGGSDVGGRSVSWLIGANRPHDSRNASKHCSGLGVISNDKVPILSLSPLWRNVLDP